jgi:hypothetical protein
VKVKVKEAKNGKKKQTCSKISGVLSKTVNEVLRDMILSQSSSLLNQTPFTVKG